MKITVTYKEINDKAVEIALPIFRKLVSQVGSCRYFAIMPDKTCSSISIISDFTSILHEKFQDRQNDEVAKIFSTWETIQEEEFLRVHANTLKSLSLQPVLKERDDLPADVFTQAQMDGISNESHKIAYDYGVEMADLAFNDRKSKFWKDIYFAAYKEKIKELIASNSFS